MAKNNKNGQSGLGKNSGSSQQRSGIGDSKRSIGNFQKAMEIPPRTKPGGKTKK